MRQTGASALKLPSGIPHIADLLAMQKTSQYRTVKEYASSFLELHSSALEPYKKKWVANPFHQWSRQWEYPFVLDRLEAFVSATSAEKTRVLDAGSGVTFFPYMLRDRNERLEVTCLDYDSSLGQVFENINATSDMHVDFKSGDLRQMPFKEGSFDLIYCISVLEHTDNYTGVVQEFKRLLANGGVLVVTFDISIDGDSDIPVDAAKNLLDILYSAFPKSTFVPPSQGIDAVLCGNDLLTTNSVVQMDRTLLPWKHPLISALSTLRKGRIPRKWLQYKTLTLFCHQFQK